MNGRSSEFTSQVCHVTSSMKLLPSAPLSFQAVSSIKTSVTFELAWPRSTRARMRGTDMSTLIRDVS